MGFCFSLFGFLWSNQYDMEIEFFLTTLNQSRKYKPTEYMRNNAVKINKADRIKYNTESISAAVTHVN